MFRRHFGREIRLWLDNRLDSHRQAEMEKHVEKCERCRRELDVLHWIKHHCVRHVSVQQGAATSGKEGSPPRDGKPVHSLDSSRGNSKRERTWGLLLAIALVSLVVALSLNGGRVLNFPKMLLSIIRSTKEESSDWN